MNQVILREPWSGSRSWSRSGSWLLGGKKMNIELLRALLDSVMVLCLIILAFITGYYWGTEVKKWKGLAKTAFGIMMGINVMILLRQY